MDLWLSLFNLWRLLIGDEKEPQPPVKLSTETDAIFAQRLATHIASADVVSFRERQSITKGLLGMAVHSSDLIHFMGISDPALVWKALENKYQATIGIRFTRLMGRVFDLPKASDSDSLTHSIKEITDIKAQFKAIESTEWKCNEYTLVQALLPLMRTLGNSPLKVSSIRSGTRNSTTQVLDQTTHTPTILPWRRELPSQASSLNVRNRRSLISPRVTSGSFRGALHVAPASALDTFGTTAAPA
jgi:hypothetical protein